MTILRIDSPFARGITKLTQLIYAGLLWFICSIPIVTLGAATTALYEVLLKLQKDEEGAIGRAFFQGFRGSLKSATLVWLPILAAELEGMTGAFGTAYLMGGYSLDAKNVLGEDERVVPREEPVSFAGSVFQWTVPPESVCVLRLHDRRRQ